MILSFVDKIKLSMTGNLEEVLQCTVEKGLTLNESLFSVPRLTFFGFKTSSAGKRPDDQKVSAIKEAYKPDEFHSFHGLENNCARFFPNLAAKAEPLHKLAQQDCDGEWSEQ